MRITTVIPAVGILILLSAGFAWGEDRSVSNRETSDIELLGRFDIIIGDTGEHFDGWEDRETRVYVETYNGRHYQQHYFDSLPAALFVLREHPDALQIVDLGVPEYSGLQHERHGHVGHGLIDGMDAWYLWDNDRYSRGGLPLILAFYDYRDAYDELYYRDGEILNLSDLIWKLDRWQDRQRDRIYWRGWDRDRWDRDRWDHAWDGRWHDCRWDSNEGWFNVNLTIGNDRGHDDHWDHRKDRDDRNNHDRDRWDRKRDKSHDRDRGRNHDNDRYRDRDRDKDHDRDKDRDRGRNRDRGKDKDRDKDSDKDRKKKGTKQTQEE